MIVYTDNSYSTDRYTVQKLLPLSVKLGGGGGGRLEPHEPTPSAPYEFIVHMIVMSIISVARVSLS